MKSHNRLEPIDAANQFVDKYFPNCDGALLAGSVVRGEATDTSDLDIIIFDDKVTTAFRKSIIELDWPIEVFVHNLTSYKHYFEADYKRSRPSLPRMVTEGIVLKDLGIIEPIKKEAKSILDAGPEKWTQEVIRMKRYFMTDVLEDFIGANNRAEELMIANTLTDLIQEFVLRSNCCWMGSSKWIIRELNNLSAEFTSHFIDAFDQFYKHGDKTKVIELVDEILFPYGGRLFDGFHLDSK